MQSGINVMSKVCFLDANISSYVTMRLKFKDIGVY